MKYIDSTKMFIAAIGAAIIAAVSFLFTDLSSKDVTVVLIVAFVVAYIGMVKKFD